MPKNKIIIITGGTGFIGSYLCQQLINEGHTIICLSRQSESAAALRKRLKNITTQNFYTYVFDINDEQSIDSQMRQIKKEHKSVDVLINNAAKRCDEFDFNKLHAQHWLDVLSVNVVTPFLLTRAVAEIMPRFGSIINIGSIYGVTSTDLNIYKAKDNMLGFNMVYGVSKAALIHLTKYLATAFGKKQIRVNSISYGGIKNRQDKDFIKCYSSKVILGRMAELEDLDGIVSFLISNKSRYITGQNIMVDGGWSL